MMDKDMALPQADRAVVNGACEQSLPSRASVPSAVRDLTESGDFYSATPAAWARYRAAVNASDWDEVMRHETGQYGDFRYAP